MKARASPTVQAAVSVCAGIAGGYFCFKLFYMAGVAWELHRFPGTNLAGLMELIVGIPVGVISGFIILIAMWIWMEPEGPASIVARGLLAASLAVLAALISFIVVNGAYISRYYGKGGGEYGFLVGALAGVIGGLLVFWLAWERLKLKRACSGQRH